MSEMKITKSKIAQKFGTSAGSKTDGYGPEEHAAFKKALVHLLVSFAKISSRHPNVKWWIDCGTLLGLYRDGDIIHNDKDCDVCVDLSTITKEWLIDLLESGLLRNKTNVKKEFKLFAEGGLVLKHLVDKDIWMMRTLTIEPSNKKTKFFGGTLKPFIDVFPKAEVEVNGEKLLTSNGPFHTLYATATKNVYPLGTMETKYGTFPVPHDIEAYLVEMYGPTWRVPDPNFGNYPGVAPGVLDDRKLGRIIFDFKSNTATFTNDIEKY